MSLIHLLYLAWGGRGLHQQTLYAAYSALAFKGALDVVVHIATDAPEHYAALAAHSELSKLTPQQLREWRGQADFVWRIKVSAIRELAARYPHDPLIYLDGDTFFYRNFEELQKRIGPHNAVLHTREYPVLTHPTRQMRRFRKNMRRFTFRGQPVDLDAWMWNAGVIGLHPAQFPLLDTILAQIDHITPHYDKGLVEQYSFSYYLQKNTTLCPCDDFIFHYWAQKSEYQQVMEPRLARWRNCPLEEALEELRQNRIQLPPPQPKKTLFEKIFGRRKPSLANPAS